MTAEPTGSLPQPLPGDKYEVIHLGGEAAVVVPMADVRRLAALQRLATAQELEDAEDVAGLAEWRARDAAGKSSYVAADEARKRLGLIW